MQPKFNFYDFVGYLIPARAGDPGDVDFIMFMEQSAGPGRGRRERVGGWTKTRELGLGEALEDPEFQDLARDFKAKLVSFIRVYLENGVL